jgi:hypothetical protein
VHAVVAVLSKQAHSCAIFADFAKLLSAQAVLSPGEGGSNNSQSESISSYTGEQQAPQPSLQHIAALQTAAAASLQLAKRANLISLADILNDDVDFDDSNYYSARSVLAARMLIYYCILLD